MSPILAENAISCIPYFGIARGFLTGKYRPGISVESVRAGGVGDYTNDRGFAVIAAIDEISKAHSSSLAAVALAWLRANPTVSAPIASARTVNQLEEIIEIVELSTADVARLNSNHSGG